MRIVTLVTVHVVDQRLLLFLFFSVSSLYPLFLC